MQLHTLPHNFRGPAPQSPVLASDSPFPALKVEHRYKGVYERAGFDVNLGQHSASDNRSFRLRKGSSPTSTKMPTPLSGPLSAPTGRTFTGSASGRSPSKPYSGKNTSVNSFSSGRRATDYRQLPMSAPAKAPKQYETYQPFQARQRREDAQNGSSPSLPYHTSNRSLSHDTLHQQPLMATDNAERNIKGLCLHIPDSNFVAKSPTDGRSESNSPTFDTSLDRDTPNTSASSSGMRSNSAFTSNNFTAKGSEYDNAPHLATTEDGFGRKNSDKSSMSVKTSELSPAPYPVYGQSENELSTMLGHLKNDAVAYKNYDPRVGASKLTRVANNPVSNFTPATGNLTTAFSKSLHSGSGAESQDDASFRFNSARQSTATGSSTNEDFQHFLQTSARGNANDRTSHLSTVSSILSKPSRSDDEEDEIDREMQRQLESLKTVSETSLVSETAVRAANISDDSFVTAFNALTQSVEQENSLPTFIIEDSSQTRDEEEYDMTPVTEKFDKGGFENPQQKKYWLTDEPAQPVHNHEDSQSYQNQDYEEYSPNRSGQDDFNNTQYTASNYSQYDHNEEGQVYNNYSQENYLDNQNSHYHQEFEEQNYGEDKHQTEYQHPEYQHPQYQHPEYQTEHQHPEYHAQRDEYSDEEDLNEVAPLSVRRISNPQMKTFLSNAPQTPMIHRGDFDDTLSFTPDTIKPLSPKNHRVEEELKDINFKYDSDATDPLGSPETINNLSGTLDDSLDDVILLKHPAPATFQAFPQSVIDPNYPIFRTNSVRGKYPAGRGPCRVCHEVVDPRAKGSQKAVYSKTDELSGQWHRGCFSCSYDNCDVKFSKHVICYALLDNGFCHQHYHSLNGTLCQTCNLGIEGECIENDMKQKWHPACLTCSKCHRGITTDYYAVEGQVMCENDAKKVIGEMRSNGLLTADKFEKRRTRMLFID